MSDSRDIKTIALFLIIAFALPLLCVMAMARIAQDSPLNLILYGVEAASPSFAAIAAVCIFKKGKGVKDFFRSNFTPKITIAAVLVPLFAAFFIMFAAKAIACLITHTIFQINPLAPKKILVIAWAFLAEEIGWRGFLQKKLTGQGPEYIAPLIIGLIWAAWHYHFFITGSTDAPIVWFVAGCIAESYIYLFLLKLSRGNILTAMLYHMCGNLFINLFGVNPGMNGGNVLPYLLSVMIAGLFGFAALIWIRKKPSKNLIN